ncbi:MAG: hypothetical protein LBD12_00675 [Clostridiales Family XIII bacterium]|jgi:hypothetical protein|nr:hypothetical protein [Clostridiales Family XIII bacterium]
MDSMTWQAFWIGMVDNVVTIGTVFGALAAISKFCKDSRLLGKLRSMVTADVERDVKDMKKALARLDGRLDDLEVMNLKHIICSPHVPIEERVRLGEEYLQKGENGAIAVRVGNLREEYSRRLAGEKVNYGRREDDVMDRRALKGEPK